MIEAVKILAKEMPEVDIVMLTIDDRDDILFQAIKNGAKGYLLKIMEPQDLYDMLDKLRRGEAAISGALAAKILRELMQPALSEAKRRKKADELSAREIRVLEEVVKGFKNKEIANTLNISQNTVKVYIRTILEKMHLRNRLQLAVHVARGGLVNGSPNLFQ